MTEFNRHTLHAFDDDLDGLRAAVAKMGGLVESAILAAMKSIAESDTELAGEVVKGDKAIDLLEREIERSVVRLIAVRAPLADDLRETIAALKISGVVERIGDYAKNIARRAPSLGFAGAKDSRALIARMGKSVFALVSDALNAFVQRDADAALKICERDQEVDQLHNEVFLALIAQMMKDPKAITVCTHLLFVAKNLERMGDHATNVAEMVYFAATGSQMPERTRWSPTSQPE